MKSPRFRFAVRRMMVAVAVVALGIAGTTNGLRMTRRAADFSSRSALHAQYERVWLPTHLALCRKNIESDRVEARFASLRWWEANLADAELRLAHHAALRRKYERAARYPWMEVEPDPSEPQWDGISRAAPSDHPPLSGQFDLETKDLDRLISSIETQAKPGGNRQGDGAKPPTPIPPNPE